MQDQRPRRNTPLREVRYISVSGKWLVSSCITAFLFSQISLPSCKRRYRMALLLLLNSAMAGTCMDGDGFRKRNKPVPIHNDWYQHSCYAEPPSFVHRINIRSLAWLQLLNQLCIHSCGLLLVRMEFISFFHFSSCSPWRTKYACISSCSSGVAVPARESVDKCMNMVMGHLKWRISL